ncbi:MAG: hypothetical protein DDT34_01919 [Firmicutes bacterium]|nr:hypothetical protein [Bacillota bacterium]
MKHPGRGEELGGSAVGVDKNYVARSLGGEDARYVGGAVPMGVDVKEQAYQSKGHHSAPALHARRLGQGNNFFVDHGKLHPDVHPNKVITIARHYRP